MASQKHGYKECPICAESRLLKSFIRCAKCDFHSCKTCTKKFLLDLTDINPQCMNCKSQWDFEFIAEHTELDFHNKIYRDRRAKILMDREKSLLPATQFLVERELKKKDMEQEIIDLDTEIYKHHQMINDLTHKRNALRQKIKTNAWEWDEQPKEKAVLRFIGHCPQEECKGYLDSQYVCGICKNKACRKCRQPKHTGDCDKNIVETVRLLAKDTKSCPGCGVPTFKISGCAQMWCTSCHTAWDWVKGKIEVGRIHNPHFYEFQRTNNPREGPLREIGDVPCGGPANQTQILGKLKECGIDRKTIEWVFNAYRLSGHIREVVLPIYQEAPYGELTHQDLRVQYMLNVFTEKEWISKLKQREKKREKNHEINLILRMFVEALDDMIANIVSLNLEEIPQQLVQMKQLRIYVTNNLQKISARFQNKTVEIDGNWNMRLPGNSNRRAFVAIIN